jgi:hypothetical protein
MKKTRSKKSRDTVPVTKTFYPEDYTKGSSTPRSIRMQLTEISKNSLENTQIFETLVLDKLQFWFKV